MNGEQLISGCRGMKNKFGKTTLQPFIIICCQLILRPRLDNIVRQNICHFWLNLAIVYSCWIAVSCGQMVLAD